MNNEENQTLPGGINNKSEPGSLSSWGNTVQEGGMEARRLGRGDNLLKRATAT